MDTGEILHYLNGAQVEEPFGWKDFTEEFDRDVKERIISVKYEAKLEFHGEGYGILNDLFFADGFCSTIAYEAKQMCGDTLRTCAKGEIMIADCEFNETKCAVTVDVADDGIGARVINNRDIPITPTAESTKNGLQLSPLGPIPLEVFDPAAAAGTWIATTRRAWDWFKAISNAVAYITDNSVTVTSAWYAALPDNERYCFLDGNELRTAAGDNPRLTYSFGDLFNELAIKYNLWIFAGRDGSGNPVLRIEPEETFYGTNNGATITDIQDLVRSVDTERLWAKVSVGSDKFIKELQAGLSLPFLVLRGFTKEEFHFSGVCNTSETLDLVNEWVIDTNVIEDVVVNNNDEYDDDMFLIQYDRTTSRATKGDYFNPGNNPYLYNGQLQNYLVVGRYDLPSPVGAFFSATDASFLAERTSADATEFYTGPPGLSALSIARFDNDYTLPNFDTTNHWGNGTVQGLPVSQANSRYTATAQGFYEFDVTQLWRIVYNSPLIVGALTYYKSIRLYIQLEHYDAGNTLIGTPQGVFTPPAVYLPGNYAMTGSIGVSLNAGDYVQLRYQYEHFAFVYQTQFSGPVPPISPSGITVQLIAGSTIRTSFVTGGGYVSGGSVARIIKYTFDRIVDLATWLALAGTPEDTITIGGGPSATTVTHMLNAKRTVATGETEWILVRRP